MPLKELERLKAVNRLLTLEVDRTKELEEIVKLAAEYCQTSAAVLTILDDQTPYAEVQAGGTAPISFKEDAFFQHTILTPDLLEVPDARQDARFAGTPLVTGQPLIRFYAGSPLTTRDGHHLGSLCVIDQHPRLLTNTQKHLLNLLSNQIIQILEFEFSINALKEQFIRARQSEIKLLSFFESSVSCHLLLNRNLQVIAFNKSSEMYVESVLGVRIREGVDSRLYIPGPMVDQFTRNCRDALLGKFTSSEREVDYGNRTVFWHITYGPARNQEGEIIGISYTATNITDRVQQERLVISQNELLRKIAFIQSHELRRPVSSILGLLDLIKSQDYFHPNQEELIMLEKAVEELDNTIRNIVDHTNQLPPPAC